MHAVVAGQNLSKTFQVRGRRGSALAALRDVTVAVHPGESVGLVGESGSGKSTLSRVLVGVERPNAGEILHLGKPVTTRVAWRALRRDVQYVFQDPYTALPPKMRVRDILAEPMRIHGIGDPHERAERVRTTLDLVGMTTDALPRYPSAFSGGQRQRICIARALVLDPKVIICDEVVSGLDVSIQAQVMNLLIDLQSQLSLGLLFISHDLRVIRYMCERVCVMYDGQIVESGTSESVFEDPNHAYTRGLLSASP